MREVRIVIHMPLLSLMYNEGSMIENKVYSFWVRTERGFVSLLQTYIH
jgi:hypothetical protein